MPARDRTPISKDDLVVVLVGLTAGWRKRRCARQHFTREFGKQAFLPWIPYSFGLRASAAWLSFRMRRKLATGRYHRIHLVAYIGGGILFRQLQAKGEHWPLGRSVWDRGPLQERVAGALTARVPGIFLTLLGFRSIVDLARTDVSSLAFPASPLGAGLLIETRSSSLAKRLGIDETLLDLSPQATRALLPGATDTIALSLSHDDVYSDPRFLDEATAFLKMGLFRKSGNEVSE